MKLRYWKYELPFIHPFTISKGTKTHQPTLIVELAHLGFKGYGEAPAITYYDISVEKMVEDIVRKKLFIEKYALTDPGRYWHYLHHLFPRNNFLVCALDIAAWDIFGKMRGVPLRQLWAKDLTKQPLTDYTIGIDSIDQMLAKVAERPWPIYKIKLGTVGDLEIVKAIRGVTNATLRVDANAGWSLENAKIIISELEKYNVELIEQPLAKDDWEGMRELMQHTNIPLIADEACVLETDVQRCAGHFSGINIKFTKCGGITPALRMINNARALGLKVMIGSMNESTVGSAAIAHLLPLADYADLDGPLLLSQDPASGLEYHNGEVRTGALPGLGIEFHPP